MPSQFKPWQLGAVLALLCALAVIVLEWRSTVAERNPSSLLDTLPPNGAVQGFIDFAKLRASGVLERLAGQKASEDQEYRDFAEQIGFDYRTDLDGIAAAYVNGGLYAAMRGRFDWRRISAYAVSQKGQCTKGICSMPASRPNQTISFDLLSKDVLGWAVTNQPLGVALIGFGKPAGHREGQVSPDAVLWISAPGSSFQDPVGLPSGTRAFFAPLATAQDASFSLQLAPGAADKFEIHLLAACASPDTAAQLAAVLTQTTGLLRGMIVRDKLTLDKGSLSSVLVSGRFEARAASVTGDWPMDRRVIEALISGQVR
jgi:hypothetical protein